MARRDVGEGPDSPGPFRERLQTIRLTYAGATAANAETPVVVDRLAMGAVKGPIARHVALVRSQIECRAASGAAPKNETIAGRGRAGCSTRIGGVLALGIRRDSFRNGRFLRRSSPELPSQSDRERENADEDHSPLHRFPPYQRLVIGCGFKRGLRAGTSAGRGGDLPPRRPS